MRGWCFFLSWWCSKFNSCQVVKDKETNPSGAQKKKSRKIYISEGTFSKLISKKHMILIDPFYLVGTSCVCVFQMSLPEGKNSFPMFIHFSPFSPHFDALTDCHCLQSKEKGWWNFYEDCKMLPGTLSAWGHIPLASTFNQFHKWIHQPNHLCCKKIITHGF